MIHNLKIDNELPHPWIIPRLAGCAKKQLIRFAIPTTATFPSVIALASGPGLMICFRMNPSMRNFACIQSHRLCRRWTQLTLPAEYYRVPQKLLLLAVEAIDDGVARVGLDQHNDYLPRFDGLSFEVDSAHHATGGDPDKPQPGAFVPYAADCAAAVAIGTRRNDIYEYDDTDDTIEPFLLDTHAYVAMELAGCYGTRTKYTRNWS